MKVLKSQLDESVNFIFPCDDGGFFEARYVRRHPDYFICYLSSHSGCNKGCRFCHLTTTGQKMMTPAECFDFVDQADVVFGHYRSQEPAKYVHFNWMARGEPLDNPFLDAGVLYELANIAFNHKLTPKFNISTIVPKTFKGGLVERFSPLSPTIYYSMYHPYQDFRDKWLPGAMHPASALDLLAEYQKVTKKVIKIHGAFIEGENDSHYDIMVMCSLIQQYLSHVEFNIVRYNPPDDKSKESPNIESGHIASWLEEYFPGNVKTVPRTDLKTRASCGMFVTADEYEGI